MNLKPDSIFKSPLTRFNSDGKVDMTEVMEYTGDDLATAVIKGNNAQSIVADEWRKKSPQTVPEITQFYTETEGYIYDLYVWPHEPEMWQLFDKMFTGNERVMDYGCGICDVAIYLAEKGCDVVATDLPGSKTLQFGMWRVYNRKLGDKIKFKCTDMDKFDAVLSIDVLEHVLWPLRYIVKLGNFLKDQSSFFFCTPRFGDSGAHPMHLEENFWLTPMNFGNAMVSLAFRGEIIVEEYFPIWRPMFLPPTQVVDPKTQTHPKG